MSATKTKTKAEKKNYSSMSVEQLTQERELESTNLTNSFEELESKISEVESFNSEYLALMAKSSSTKINISAQKNIRALTHKVRDNSIAIKKLSMSCTKSQQALNKINKELKKKSPEQLATDSSEPETVVEESSSTPEPVVEESSETTPPVLDESAPVVEESAPEAEESTPEVVQESKSGKSSKSKSSKSKGSKSKSKSSKSKTSKTSKTSKSKSKSKSKSSKSKSKKTASAPAE